MKSKILAFALFLAFTSMALAASRHWKSGTLTATDQQKVAEGTTHSSSSDATYKNKGNRTDYSQNTTSTTSDN